MNNSPPGRVSALARAQLPPEPIGKASRNCCQSLKPSQELDFGLPERRRSATSDPTPSTNLSTPQPLSFGRKNRRLRGRIFHRQASKVPAIPTSAAVEEKLGRVQSPLSGCLRPLRRGQSLPLTAFCRSDPLDVAFVTEVIAGEPRNFRRYLLAIASSLFGPEFGRLPPSRRRPPLRS